MEVRQKPHELARPELAAVERMRNGGNYCSDPEIMREITELVAEDVGDVAYGSGVLDPARHQATFRLEDGRQLRLTMIFTSA